MQKEFCQSVIEYFEENQENQIIRNIPDFYNFSEIDIPNIYNVLKLLNKEIPHNTSDIINYFYNSCNSIVNDYKSTLQIHNKQFPDVYNYENCRIKKYNKGEGFFSEHVDVRNYETAKRFLVIILYLNDVEEGGETNFPDYGISIKPSCGDVLVFPSTWTHLHQGNKPISSDKYILGTYLQY
jgi:hypothetical protein